MSAAATEQGGAVAAAEAGGGGGGGSTSPDEVSPPQKPGFEESVNTFGYLIMSLIGTVSCVLIAK